MTKEKKDLPVINVEDTPENANWLRTVGALRRAEEAAGKKQPRSGR
jgi:hypothetical protein